MTPAILLALLAQYCSGGGNTPLETYARSTTYRDAYGVPHIYANSREAAFFALGYAQAEDDVQQVSRNIHGAVGDLAQYGLGPVSHDVLVRQLHIPQSAQRDFDQLPLASRSVADSFAQGVNTYVDEHSGLPSWVTPIEGWQVVALASADPVLEEWTTALDKYNNTPPDSEGSNAFAVGRTRSAADAAMVGGQPQVPFDGPEGPKYEAHLVYPGVNAAGATSYGTPALVVGATDDVGWSGTNNVAQFAAADVYRVTTDTAHPGEYLFDGQWVPFAVENYDIQVRNGDGSVTVEHHAAQFTRQGPVVAQTTTNAYAAKLSLWENNEHLEQGIEMLEAHDMTQFKAALALDTVRANLVAADHLGHLFYVYAVPAGVRPDGPYDWSKPVDGSTSATDWRGIVPFSALPQIDDPTEDAIANANDGPWGTLPGYLNPADYPSWLVWQNGTTERGDRLRDLLAGGPFTFAGFQDVAVDDYIPTAASVLPLLEYAWGQLRGGYTAAERARGDQAIQILHDWDRHATLASTAMTLYTTWALWMLQLGQVSFDPQHPPAPAAVSATDQARMANALRVATNYLQQNAGTITIAWGFVHRVDRDGRQAPAHGGWNHFGATRGKVMAAAVFEGHVDELNGNVLEVRSGSSYVFVAELGPNGSFHSILPWGESPDPASPHYFDQAAKWGAGQLRDVMKHDEAAVRAQATETTTCDVLQLVCTAS